MPHSRGHFCILPIEDDVDDHPLMDQTSRDCHKWRWGCCLKWLWRICVVLFWVSFAVITIILQGIHLLYLKGIADRGNELYLDIQAIEVKVTEFWNHWPGWLLSLNQSIFLTNATNATIFPRH